MQVDTNVVGSKCHFDASLYYAAADLQPLPRVQYLSANCVLLTYTDGDLAGQLDEHFTKSLSGKGGRHYRNFPPSFWNQNYNRCFRNQLASANDNTMKPSVGVSLQNSMTYFHDTYPSLIRSTAANHSFWTSYAAAGQTPSRSVLPASSSHATAYGSADGTHFNVKEQTYQHLLGLTKPVAHHHHHHNLLAQSGQYAGLRSDWYLLPDCSNRDLSHHINQSGLQCTIDIQRTVQMLRSQRSVIVQTEAQYSVLKTLDVSIQTFATVQKPLLRGDSNERISIQVNHATVYSSPVRSLLIDTGCLPT